MVRALGIVLLLLMVCWAVKGVLLAVSLVGLLILAVPCVLAAAVLHGLDERRGRRARRFHPFRA